MNVTVNTSQGALRGERKTGAWGRKYCAFLGVPYAKPPVGPLRFKPPQPAEKWTGVRDATKSSSIAPQIDAMPAEYAGDEDCLYLNVYTRNVPKDSYTNLAPVMVWIHGGGFLLGSGSFELYGPDYFMGHEIVLVSINYRLGVLGFCSTGDHVISGNMGLKDQVLALKWVQNNIASFGGDPKNVTIFGESAGAVSCHSLILSPMGKGLFHRAILMSGVIQFPNSFSDLNQRRTYKLVEILGGPTGSSEQVAAFLKDVPARTLVESEIKCTLDEDRNLINILRFTTVVESPDAEGGAFFTEPPEVTLKRGNYNKVPIMIGVTSFEGGLMFFDRLLHVLPISDLNTNFQKILPPEVSVKEQERRKLWSDLKKFYFGDKALDETTVQQYADLMTDLLFAYPAIMSAKLHASGGLRSLYMYIFDVDAGLNYLKKGLGTKYTFPGAYHGDELSYIFRTPWPELSKLTPDPQSLEAKVVADMTALWTNFAKTGNPTPEGDSQLGVTWPPFSPKKGNVMHITNNGLVVNEDFFKKRMDFLEQLFSHRQR